MLRKPRRPESDIEQLAQELRSRVRFGDNVEAWMRRNVVRLTKLVRDQGWRWEDVGIAMTRAGITYSTGRPWTPEVLRVKASEARAQIRIRRERANKSALETCRSAPPTRYVLAVAQSPDQASPLPAQRRAAERPTFAPARLVHQHETSPMVSAPPAEQTASTPTTHDADAVMRRFFRTPPSSE